MAANVKKQIFVSCQILSKFRSCTRLSDRCLKNRGTVGRSDEDTEDVRLMQLVSRGDTRAFEERHRTAQSLVAGTVARMLGSNSDVEDIAQQVFIRVWKSARRYVPRAKFTTWLLKNYPQPRVQ
jgi:DNA-directed RNA polymerase specialized sigma subunit, sigma24 homolog